MYFFVINSHPFTFPAAFLCIARAAGQYRSREHNQRKPNNRSSGPGASLKHSVSQSPTSQSPSSCCPFRARPSSFPAQKSPHKAHTRSLGVIKLYLLFGNRSSSFAGKDDAIVLRGKEKEPHEAGRGTAPRGKNCSTSLTPSRQPRGSAPALPTELTAPL